ncbi:hypothetical protein D3C87_899190 [compost metagenome]
MSPLLRNRLSVAICPTQISITPIQRGWKPQILKTDVINILPVDGVDGWKLALAALSEWLEKNQVSKVDIVISVSGSLVRYALLPWVENTHKRSELLTLMHIHFETLYGEPSMNWTMVAEQGKYGKPRIACAIDKDFVFEIENICKSFKIKLILLQPYFMSVFNHWRRQIGEQALLCIVESDLCIFASLKNGSWNSIRSHNLFDVRQADIKRLCEREIVLQGLGSQENIFLHSSNSEILMKYSSSQDFKILATGSDTAKK